MAKHKDILRDLAFWGGLDKTAQDQHQFRMQPREGPVQVAGRIPPDRIFHHDINHNGQFADWLQERDDPRHIVVRGAKYDPEWESASSLSQTTEPFSFSDTPYDVGRIVFPNDAPRAFNNERTGGGVLLGHAWRSHDPTLFPSVIVLRWHARVPSKLSSGPGRDARYTAVVTPDQLREFIGGLKSKAQQKQWVRYAQQRGWLPHKLARATSEIGTTQHQKRLEIARQILKEAGIKPATVRAALAAGDRAGVVQILAGRVHPALAKYVAAWFGLLSGERTQTVFHPTDGGKDTLHVITTAHAPDQVADMLRDSGAQGYSVEPRARGSRAYLFNSNNEFDVSPVLRALGDAKHVAIPGVGTRIGSPESDAAARDAYRNTIRNFENGSDSAAGG